MIYISIPHSFLLLLCLNMKCRSQLLVVDCSFLIEGIFPLWDIYIPLRLSGVFLLWDIYTIGFAEVATQFVDHG